MDYYEVEYLCYDCAYKKNLRLPHDQKTNWYFLKCKDCEENRIVAEIKIYQDATSRKAHL